MALVDVLPLLAGRIMSNLNSAECSIIQGNAFGTYEAKAKVSTLWQHAFH